MPIMAQAPAPAGFPSPYSSNWYRVGFLQEDSGGIYGIRDTTIRPRFQGYRIMWPHAGLDTSVWVYNGSRYVKELNTQDTLPGRFLVTTSFLASQGYLKNITGYVQQGSNVTITGAGTLVSPYIINSTSSGGVDSAVNPGLFLSQSIVGTTKTIFADTGLFSSYYLRRKDSSFYVTQNAFAVGLSGKFNIPSGSTLQYVRGDGSLATFPTNLSAFLNGPGYITGNQPISFTASGDINGTFTNPTNLTPTLTINANAVTYSKFQAAVGQGLLGAQAAGNYQLITLGAGLSMISGVLNTTGGGGGGCLNCNADSLKKLPIDTSLRRNGYALTFDSVNRKWVLAPNGAGSGAVSTVSNIDATLTISPTTGAVVASLNLGHSNTWGVGQTFNGSTSIFNGGVQIGSAVSFSTDNTYSIGSSGAAAQRMWAYGFSSPGALNLSTGTSAAMTFTINGNVGMTLSSTRQFQLNNYTTATSYTGTPLAFLQTDASGNVIQIPVASVQGAITLTTTGTSGAATLIGTTLNIPQYSGGGGGNTNSNIGSGFRWAVPNTNNIKTVSGSLIIIDSSTNTNALTFTADTTSGSQKVATQGFVGRQGFITLTSLSASSPLAYNNTTGAFTIQVSNTSQSGYLSSTDWNTFNGKQSAISLTTTGASGAATFISNTLNIPQYQGALTLTTTGTSGAATLIGATLNIPQYTGGGGGGGGLNIYNGDSTLSSNRTVTMSGRFLNFSGGLVKSDSIYLGPITIENTTGDSIAFIGTSITFGTGPTSNYYRFSSVATRQLSGYGFVEYNLGVPGSTLASQIGNIPRKTPGKRFLVIEFGTNELVAAMDSATFRTGYITFLDTCLARGWVGSQMTIISQMAHQFGASGMGTTAQMKGYNYVDSTLSLQFGTAYADCWNPELNSPKFAFLLSSPNSAQIHPNNIQSYYLGSIVAGAIPSTYTNKKYRMAVRDTSQFDNIILKNNHFMTDGQVLGLDSAGHVGVIKTLHNNFTAFGNFYIGSNLQSTFAVRPSTWDSTRDWLIAPDAKIHQTFSATGGQNGYLQIWGATNSGIGSWVNNYAAGQIQLIVNSTTPLAVASGVVNFANAVKLTGNSSRIDKDFVSATNFIDPFENGTGIYAFQNGYSAGSFQFRVSKGVTTSTGTNALNMFPSGNVAFQDGGTFTDIASARVQINSTTQGVLIPAMSTSLRNSIAAGRISGVTVNSNGSGYTNGTYTNVPLTGGSGTGATATITVTSGAASASFPLTNPGSGYKIGDVLSINNASVGGTGSGFQVTVSFLFDDGLVVYNNETHRFNWYSGPLGWRTLADSASSGSQTLEQVLTTGSTLTNPHTITNTGQIFTLNNGGTGAFKLSGILTDTTNAAYLLFKKKDSSIAEMSFANLVSYLPADTLNAANGLNITGTGLNHTIGIGGTLNQNTTISMGGFSFTFTGNSGAVGLVLSSGQYVQTTGALAVSGWIVVTTTGNVTTSGTGYGGNVLDNPASAQTSYTFEMPTSQPDGAIVNLHFGGTIANGSTVTTSFTATVHSGSGAVIYGSTPSSTVVSGDYFSWKYYAAGNAWYREH